MTPPRLVQNFRGSRAILWAGPTVPTETLAPTLAKLGVSLLRMEQFDPSALDGNRDIVLADGDCLQEGGSALPVPVIGLVGIEAPSRLKALLDIGAAAFLRKPVHAAAVYSSLFLAVNAYHRQRLTDRLLADHERRRRGRRFVIKAVVHLVRSEGLDDEQAFEQLRRDSMRARRGLEDYCEAFVQDVAPNPTVQEIYHAEESDAGCRGHRLDRGERAGDRLGPGGRSDQARRA